MPLLLLGLCLLKMIISGHYFNNRKWDHGSALTQWESHVLFSGSASHFARDNRKKMFPVSSNVTAQSTGFVWGSCSRHFSPCHNLQDCPPLRCTVRGKQMRSCCSDKASHLGVSVTAKGCTEAAVCVRYSAEFSFMAFFCLISLKLTSSKQMFHAYEEFETNLLFTVSWREWVTLTNIWS